MLKQQAVLVPFLILFIFTAIGLLPLPYKFYMLSRGVFAVTLTVVAFQLYKFGGRSWIAAGLLVALYNPVVPVYLKSKILWFVANFLTLCFVYYSTKKIQRGFASEHDQSVETEILKRTAELEKTNAELLYIAEHDALTGVANRLAATKRLKAEFKRMKRTSTLYAVMMLDIDFFKKINDAFGHAIGDQALRSAARSIQSSVRETDFVARFGGEEFMILLPDTAIHEAATVAEKIRHTIETQQHPTIGQFTVSIGIAMAMPDHETEFDAVNKADELLYVAKHEGRNRVVAAVDLCESESQEFRR